MRANRLIVAAICLLVVLLLVRRMLPCAYPEPVETHHAQQSEQSSATTKEDQLPRSIRSSASKASDASGVQTSLPDEVAHGSDDGPHYVQTSLDTATEQSRHAEHGVEESPPYAPETVLLSISEAVSAARANELIANTDAVVSQEVTTKQVGKGFIELQVAPGYTVEEAVAALDEADEAFAAQPDYIYYALLGDEADLRLRLCRGAEPLKSAHALPCEATAMQGEGMASASEDSRTVSAATSSDGLARHGHTEDQDAVQPVGSSSIQSVQDDGEGTISPSNEQVSDSSDVVRGDYNSDANAGGIGAGAAAELPEESRAPEPVGSESPEDASSQSDDSPVSPNTENADDSRDSLQEALEANDPYASSQWALTSMRVYEAWAYATCDGNVGVAVLDEGPDPSHEDLIDNVREAYDVYAHDSTPSILVNHGTHVSGTVGATVDNGIGVAGVSHNAALTILNVFHKRNNDASSTQYITKTSTLLEAYRYLMDNRDSLGVRVVNLSLGVKKSSKSTFNDDALVSCIDDAFEKGIVTVAAAGNSDLGTPPYYEYPGDASNVVSVMNLRQTSSGVSLSTTSNYNVDGQTSKNICAPGTNIRSTALNDSYQYMSGTSMAAPHVSGVLALEFAANPDLTARQAVNILYATAQDLGEEGWDVRYGWGAVDACAAVQMAKEGTSPQLPDISDYETPLPSVQGPTRIPVGGHAQFKVKNGSLQIKAGESAATLDDCLMTGVSEGLVTISVLDERGIEQATRNVVVYATSGCWTLQAAADTSYVLDVKGGSVLNSANAQLYTSNGKSNQVWLLEPQADGSYVLRSGKSGKVLDVSGGSQRAGANVIQYAPSGKAWQRWKLMVNTDNSITFVNVNSSMALELATKPANSVNVRQGEESRKPNQRWALQSVTTDIGPIWDGIYKVASSINKSYVLDVQRASTSNGGNVQLYRSNGNDNQRWRFEYLGNGVYKIVNVNSGKVLDVARGTLKNSVNIDQWSWNKGSNQRWELAAHEDGSYGIMRAGTTWAVDVKGAVAENGRNVHQYQSKQNKAQRWYLTQY